MSSLLAWLDDRTGVRKIAHAALYHNVPGGARWRYVLGHTVLFALLVQIITGVALWFCYAPSAQTAWESVFYLQNIVPGGWFLRGLHHFNAQVLTVLLALRLAQIIIDGSAKAPREVTFWLFLAQFLFVLAASVTGWLLPWDQTGFWATKVATNILSITPGVGSVLQQMVVGGPTYGHQTLMRFFALHGGVIPGCLMLLIVLHLYMFKRYGYPVEGPKRGWGATYWPDQALRDATGCLAFMAVLVVWTVSRHGAELGPPADPTVNFSAARPEWFFLPLYQFLKYFPGGKEVIGAMVVPGLILFLVALMPFTARWRWGQRFNVLVLLTIVIGAGTLLWRAVAADKADLIYLAARQQLENDAARVKVLALAPQGIPVAGAVTLLRNDPLTQGPRLFARYCASCHRYDGQDGLGAPVKDPETASDLKGFGSRPWLTGLLDLSQVAGPHYFGGTAHKKGKMVKFVKTKVANFTPAQQMELREVIAAVSAEAHLPAQKAMDAGDAEAIKAASTLISGDIGCADCHMFHQPDTNADAPDLTGYASRDWLVSFIGNPKQDHFYGADNDRMPAFLTQGILTSQQIQLLADWLRGE